jgi:hypothetical protein
MILAPLQHTLTEFALHSNVYVGASSGMSFAGLHFPHLCTHSLRNLVFDASVGADFFIVRHASSLLRLVLLSCKLPAHRGITPSDGWNSIWDRFAVELTALVSLHVDNPECSYVYVGHNPEFQSFDNASPNISFFLHCARQSRDATDFEALKRLRSVVTARSGGNARGILRKERKRLMS